MRLIDGPIPKGVALLRPPGHHARPAKAMGFCLLNNVAVAAAHARSRGLERVAVVDWDVHHGNGTQEISGADPHVLYVSTHQFPFYPGTGDTDEVGDGGGKGFTVNVPLAARRRRRRVRARVRAGRLAGRRELRAGARARERRLRRVGPRSARADGALVERVRLDGSRARAPGRAIGEGTDGARARRGYDLVALEAGLGGAIDGMLARAAPTAIAPSDDEGVTRAARWAKKSWSHVD